MNGRDGDSPLEQVSRRVFVEMVAGARACRARGAGVRVCLQGLRVDERISVDEEDHLSVGCPDGLVANAGETKPPVFLVDMGDAKRGRRGELGDNLRRFSPRTVVGNQELEPSAFGIPSLEERLQRKAEFAGLFVGG